MSPRGLEEEPVEAVMYPGGGSFGLNSARRLSFHSHTSLAYHEV